MAGPASAQGGISPLGGSRAPVPDVALPGATNGYCPLPQQPN